MTTTAPAQKNTTRKAILPPDERFWKRYSPHGEGPLSGVASVTLHCLVVGLAALWAFYLIYAFFPKLSQSLPIEPVRLADGGGKGGSGVKPGDGDGPPKDVGDDKGQPLDKGDGDQPDRPPLTPIEKKVLDQFPQADRHVIQDGPRSHQGIIDVLEKIHKKASDGLKPGKGDDGPGDGDGKGPGTAKLSEREKRMLRWSMQFTTTNSADYLAQLRDLGAILAVPVGPKGEYKTIHDLAKKPAELQDEDLSKIQRIWWIDDKPENVRGLLEAMGLPMDPTPARIVAFIPRDLEDELAAKELKFKGLTEEQIYETKFRVERRDGKYEVRVVDQKAK